MADKTNSLIEDGAPDDPHPAERRAELIRTLMGPSTTAYQGNLTGDAIERLTELAREGSEPKLIMIPTQGLGTGLPAQVPVLFDRHMQEPIGLMHLIEEARPDLERRGIATVHTLASFVELVNRHKDEGSAIFATTAWPKPKLTAVIDYHTADHDARHCAHRVAYDFPLTVEFKAWVDGSGKAMSQVDFAEFLEEHAAELAAPTDGERSEYEPKFKERFATPAELLDLSRSLEVFVGATVKQGVRLQSGERQVEFITEHTLKSGEKIDIPGIFMVSVAPFLSGDAEPQRIRLPARIRYRLKDGALTWFYQLYRWEFWLRERVQQDLAEAAKSTNLPAYEGAPELAA